MRVPEISVFWRDAVLGGLILLAISTDFAIGKRLRRLWTSPARRGRPRRRSGRRRRMRDRVLRWRTELLLAAILLGVVAVNVSLSPFYLRTRNFVNMFQLSIEKAIVAVIMTLVIINGEIDLSVASVMGFSAAVVAALHEWLRPLRCRRGRRPARRCGRRPAARAVRGPDGAPVRWW